MRKISDWIRYYLLPVLIYGFIKTVGGSMRIQIVGAEQVRENWKQGVPFILSFWHGRQLMIPLAYEGKNVHILISQHRDGELISRVMVFFGYRTIRGSTTKGAIAGLKGMVRAIRGGSDLAITPDGPRGPRYVVQGGVLEMAKLAQVPIYPVSFGASKKKSWALGMVFLFLFLFPRGYLFGGNLFGCQEM
ncbi:MAG TPA: lysophospholipid acyltransferase family protein [Nitrospiria bacterium]|jgi:lysophospholipid acyltransferase (LPLAT)-like uncharacterized protein